MCQLFRISHDSLMYTKAILINVGMTVPETEAKHHSVRAESKSIKWPVRKKNTTAIHIKASYKI